MALFVGLDGEMSGPDPWKHKLIQIGVARPDGELYVSRIGWDELSYEPGALAAVGIEPSAIPDGPPAVDVDRQLCDWLAARGADRGGVVPVGWGVSTFDLAFVCETLPQTAALLSHRSVELNAVCYTLAHAVEYEGRRPGANDWKRMSKAHAEEHLRLRLGRAPSWHDAGYDAQASMFAWLWLRSVLTERVRDVATRGEAPVGSS